MARHATTLLLSIVLLSLPASACSTLEPASCEVTADCKGPISDGGEDSDKNEAGEIPSEMSSWNDAATRHDASVTGDASRSDAASTPAACATCKSNQYCCNEQCKDLVTHRGAPLVSIGECGAVVYGRYLNRRDGNAPSRPANNRIPDFSFAGYRGGGVKIPDLPVRVRLGPGSGDDRARIQAAIDKVSARTPDANGHRGAVLLERGTYQVGAPLVVKTSGVVLRGSGQHSQGTVLLATRREQHSLIQVTGSGAKYSVVDGSRVNITNDFIPVGSRAIRVSDSSPFSPGDMVVVEYRRNQAWINALGMARYGWTPSSYRIEHERRIERINGDWIALDVPLVEAIDKHYGGAQLLHVRNPKHVQEVGIENLRIDSVYSSSTDENHGWTGVLLSRARNAWVRRVTVEHFGYSAVAIADLSAFNTVEDSAFIRPVSRITGGRRYAFYLDDASIGNLFQRNYASRARHSFVSTSRVSGPNVWLDCVAEDAYSDDGPHHRWATGLLFDNIRTRRASANVSAGRMQVQNRTDSGTGHGWSGAQTLFYNSSAEAVVADAPKGAMNWSIGTSGARKESFYSPSEPAGIFESHGTRVRPRSLYLAQLKARLGAKAVENVTLPQQRKGEIWNMLRDWRGEGRLDRVADPTCDRGIAAGNVCCAKSCGTCGGSGCGDRSGGADSCCTSNIRERGVSCFGASAPCILP